MQPSPFLLLLSASAIALSADASRGYDYGGDSNGVKPPLHTSPNWVNAQRVYGNLGYGLPFTTEASMALKCPTFVNCAPSIQALAPVKTLVKSSAGTVYSNVVVLAAIILLRSC